jgi:hypothetical protein
MRSAGSSNSDRLLNSVIPQIEGSQTAALKGAGRSTLIEQSFPADAMAMSRSQQVFLKEGDEIKLSGEVIPADFQSSIFI